MLSGRWLLFVGGFATSLVLGGCMGKLEEQVKPKGTKVLGKFTQDIKEFDPKAGKVVSDSEIKITNPVTGALEAYGPILERISKDHVEYAMRLYEAEHGHYPKTYNEFMEKIIKANNIKLPVLPGDAKYEYDAKNKKLVVVKAADGEAKPK